MATTAALRIQIEASLATRFPAALSPMQRSFRETAATGIAALDALLEGGLPVGAISEVVGPECSGRTTLSLAFLAGCTARGQACAWVDACDALDPESAAASGVHLPQLLWIRCTTVTPATESPKRRTQKSWSHLDQALRATDLLLQAGGFAALVLDLGGVDPAQGMRIPLATWFRFRQAADRTRCSLLVLGQASYAQSSAAVVLDCSSLRAEVLGGTVLHSCTFEVSRRRERFSPQGLQRGKPPAAAWGSSTAWAAERSA